jgi:integrase
MTVREGSVRIHVHRSPKRIGGRTITAWEFRWRDGAGRPRRLKRARKTDAIREARRIAKELASGRSAELSSSDVASFRAGITNLFGCGVSIEAATAEYAEAHRRLAGRGSVLEAADFFARHHGAGGADRTITEVVTELIQARRAERAGLLHLKDLRERLGRFAGDVQCPIDQLSAPLINEWLAGLHLSPRSVKNYRGAISNLIEFAVGAKYLPATFAEMRFVKVPKVGQGDRQIFTIAEMRLLLKHASESLLPVLVLGGFAGLRTSETRHICWEHVHWDSGVITVPRGKTGERLAPLMDNAAEWLRLIRAGARTKDGPVVGLASSSVSNGMLRAAAAANQQQDKFPIAWKRNALRRSFVSYWSSFEHDLWKVSERTGHSVAMLKKAYQQSGTLAETGRAWFEIRPESRQLYLFDHDHDAKICPLPAPSTNHRAETPRKMP